VNSESERQPVFHLANSPDEMKNNPDFKRSTLNAYVLYI